MTDVGFDLGVGPTKSHSVGLMPSYLEASSAPLARI